MTRTNDKPRRPAAAARRRPSAVSPRDVLFVLFRQGRKALLAGAVVAAAGATAAALLPDEYRSEAEMLVRLGRESVTLDATASIGTTVQPIQTRESEINSELEMLKSRGLAEAVVRRVGAGRILGEPDAAHAARPQRSGQTASPALADLLGAGQFDRATLEVMRNLDASAVPETNVLSVAYEAKNAALARDVVAAFTGEYQDLRLRVYGNPETAAFFDRQHADADARLSQIQADIRRVKDESGLADIATQRTNLLNRIGDLRSRGADARAALAGSRAAVRQLEERLATMPANVVTGRTVNAPNSSVETLRARLSELRIDEKDVTSRYVEGSPTVVTVRAKLAQAEAELAEAEANAQETTGLNANREALALRLEVERADAAAAEARAGELAGALSRAESELAPLNATQVRLDELQRRAAVAEADVMQYAKAQREAGIDSDLKAGKITNISLYQPAELPLEPTGPNRVLLLVAGLALAGIAAGGVAFVAESLDHAVKRPDDLRRIGHRSDNVVSVPRLTNNAVAARSARDHWDDFTGGLRYILRGANRGTANHGLPAFGRYVAASFLRVGEGVVSLLALPAKIGRTRRDDPALAARLAGTPHFVHAADDLTLDGDDGLSLAGGRAIIAEHEAIQDLDDDERPDVEPKADPDPRGLLRRLRVVAYAVRRDAAAWWDRDDRPNLQLTDRRGRTAAAEAVWVGARGAMEQVMIEADPERVGRVPASFAVVGCRPHSGASTVAMHLAAVVAERMRDADEAEGRDEGRNRVLLLTLASSDCGEGDATFSPEPTPVRNLMRAELRTSGVGAVRRALEAARADFDHVVLDLPPVFNDWRGDRRLPGDVREDAGPRLAGLCEVTVAVIEADALRREAAEEALGLLERAGAAPSAVVFNKRSYPIPQWVYRRA